MFKNFKYFYYTINRFTIQVLPVKILENKSANWVCKCLILIVTLLSWEKQHRNCGYHLISVLLLSDLCDAGYVGFTRRHLHQRVDEHRQSSSIGKHFHDKHCSTSKDLTTNFTILKEWNSKFDCLVYECFLLTNWDQVSMYNVTQFVRKFSNIFLISLLIFFIIIFLHAFIVFNTPLF